MNYMKACIAGFSLVLATNAMAGGAPAPVSGGAGSGATFNGRIGDTAAYGRFFGLTGDPAAYQRATQLPGAVVNPRTQVVTIPLALDDGAVLLLSLSPEGRIVRAKRSS